MTSTRSMFPVIDTGILLLLNQGVGPVRSFRGPLQRPIPDGKVELLRKQKGFPTRGRCARKDRPPAGGADPSSDREGRYCSSGYRAALGRPTHSAEVATAGGGHQPVRHGR